MTITSTVPVKFSAVKTEWTGSSQLGAYLRDGAYVKSTDTGVSNVPTTFPIKLQNFLGSAKVWIRVVDYLVVGDRKSVV